MSDQEQMLKVLFYCKPGDEDAVRDLDDVCTEAVRAAGVSDEVWHFYDPPAESWLFRGLGRDGDFGAFYARGPDAEAILDVLRPIFLSALFLVHCKAVLILGPQRVEDLRKPHTWRGSVVATGEKLQ